MRVHQICNNKAVVINFEDKRVLVSYETVVLSWDRKTNTFKRHWDGWSQTTGKHIKEFAQCLGIETPNKAWFCGLELTPYTD